MTKETRTHLRLLRDRKVRERLHISATGRKQRRAEMVTDCGDCGGNKNLWTVGCTACINRHKKRNAKALKCGLPRPVVEKVHRCRVCRFVIAERGADCSACREAQSLGVERRARRAEQRCVGCETELGNHTTDCVSCAERHAARSYRARKTEAVATSLRESATASDRKKVAA